MKTQTLEAGATRSSGASPSANELVLSRLLNAPHDFTITHCKGDLRVGGAWRTGMVSPEGVEHRGGGVYCEVVPVERLAFTHAWDDEDGRPGPETLVTLALFEEGAGTRLHLHQQKFPSIASRNGHQIGWSESFDRLNDHLNELQNANALCYE